MVNSIMSDMRSKMFDVHRNFDQIGTGSDAHSFKSSSIKTYSKVGDTAPKVFEATSQTCKVPGGIKETRQAVRDSESGVAKMAVGHHIQDRSHVIEKRMNTKTGNEEVHQEFCNLDESEAPTFDEEWCRKISKFKTPGRKSYLDAPKHKGCHRAEMGPKDGGSGKQKSHPKPTVEGSRRPKVSYGSPQY
ncbi:myeloid leukemia factor 1 isoform X2 [Rhinatrema bivittatum]|nr:myeloid leukemia factor 1 isoform X2 [Rhinatrema bivittatum]